MIDVCDKTQQLLAISQYEADNREEKLGTHFLLLAMLKLPDSAVRALLNRHAIFLRDVEQLVDGKDREIWFSNQDIPVSSVLADASAATGYRLITPDSILQTLARSEATNAYRILKLLGSNMQLLSRGMEFADQQNSDQQPVPLKQSQLQFRCSQGDLILYSAIPDGSISTLGVVLTDYDDETGDILLVPLHLHLNSDKVKDDFVVLKHETLGRLLPTNHDYLADCTHLTGIKRTQAETRFSSLPKEVVEEIMQHVAEAIRSTNS